MPSEDNQNEQLELKALVCVNSKQSVVLAGKYNLFFSSLFFVRTAFCQNPNQSNIIVFLPLEFSGHDAVGTIHNINSFGIHFPKRITQFVWEMFSQSFDEFSLWIHHSRDGTIER